MSKPLRLFDYIYYRVYRFFKERGDSISEYSATIVLSVIQCLTLLDIIVLIRIFYPFPFPDKILVVAIIGVVGALNWLRYERNFDIQNLAFQWKDENQHVKTRNGWFIGVYLLISFLIPAVHGYLDHNLDVL